MTTNDDLERAPATSEPDCIWPLNALRVVHRVLPNRVTLVAVAGEIDIATAPRLRAYCERHAWPGGTRHLVFDLAAVPFMDSSGVDILVDAYAAAARDGGTVRVAAPSPLVTRIFRVLGLAGHIPVHATVQDALAAVVTVPRRALRRTPVPASRATAQHERRAS